MNSPTKVASLKKGDYFTIANHDNEEVDSSVVWVRGEYDRSSKRYECCSFDDINVTRYLRALCLVYVDMIF